MGKAPAIDSTMIKAPRRLSISFPFIHRSKISRRMQCPFGQGDVQARSFYGAGTVRGSGSPDRHKRMKLAAPPSDYTGPRVLTVFIGVPPARVGFGLWNCPHLHGCWGQPCWCLLPVWRRCADGIALSLRNVCFVVIGPVGRAVRSQCANAMLRWPLAFVVMALLGFGRCCAQPVAVV